MRLALAAVMIALSACSQGSTNIPVYHPAPGANETVRGPIAAAPGHSLVTADIVLGPDGVVPRHYHHGEEFLSVIGGSVTLRRPGVPDLVLRPGEGVRIAPGIVHSAIAGSDGLRAVSSWVLPDGKPLREALAD